MGIFQCDLASTIGVDFKYKDLKIQALNPETKFADIANMFDLKHTSRDKCLKSLSTKKQELFERLSNEINVHLQLWDTAGQEIYRTVTKAYYKGSNAALIIFDVTSRNSFDSVLGWAEEINSVLGDNLYTERNKKGKVHLYLVGNKIDLSADRVITKEEAENLAVQLYKGKFTKDGVDGDAKTEDELSYKDIPMNSYFEISAKSGDGVDSLFNYVTKNLLVGSILQDVETEEDSRTHVEFDETDKNKSRSGCFCGGGDENESSSEESSSSGSEEEENSDDGEDSYSGEKEVKSKNEEAAN